MPAIDRCILVLAVLVALLLTPAVAGALAVAAGTALPWVR